MAKSVVDIAIEHLDAQIAELQRAKDILLLTAKSVNAGAVAATVRKPRGRPKKAGLPAQDAGL